jgi:hypothetical protein
MPRRKKKHRADVGEPEKAESTPIFHSEKEQKKNAAAEVIERAKKRGYW